LVAPYSTCIVYPCENPELLEVAIHTYDTLDMLPLLQNRVLLDNRDHSVGYKLNDARFMGYPYTLVIGRNYQESGKFELIHRWTGTRHHLDSNSLSSFFTEKQRVDDHSR
jgi:prolyl-tRNA synthetase